MLRKLFSHGSGAADDAPDPSPTSSQRLITSLDSVQEDIHTRNLLFPDAQALYMHLNDQVFQLPSSQSLPAAPANAFDYSGDIDLDTRDVRVLVMQDALGSSNASLLFDTHPGPSIQTPTAEKIASGASPILDQRRTPTSPRKSSIGHAARPVIVQPDSPQPRQGAFDRRSSMHGRSQTFVETETQRAAREYREEIGTFSSCIFGSSELMSYKGTSTKVHVVPTESRFSEYSTSFTGDGRGSVGRSSARSSRLAQSYSSEVISPSQTSPSMTTNLEMRQRDRKKVLITRLFPVVIPTDDGESTRPSEQRGRFSDDLTSYPFPQAGEDPMPKKKKQQPKQRRTPMYAVVLVIQLPRTHGPTTATTPLSKPQFRGPGSFTEQDSFPSSYNSSRRSGWAMVGPMAFDGPETPLTSDTEDRMDYITQHWDIIMRTLTHLQSVVATTLGALLKKADIASPDPYPAVSQLVARTSSISSRRFDEQQLPKPPKSNAKLVTLMPNALAHDAHVSNEIENARTRIVTGLRASRIVTGQGRWGIWRDEARLLAKWSGASGENMFLFKLLTGFLATHTDWLQALSPASCRKRFMQQQRARGEEDVSVPARTVVVSEDKMAARRLVFLLSAFLPANQQLPTVRTHRPSTSASHAALSHSPPSYVVPILREESLRRKINRRAGPRRGSHSRTVSSSTRASGVPAQLAHLSMEGHHERRSSDAISVRTTSLAIPYSDLVSRKSSAATTTTITPDTTVPHFSSAHQPEGRRNNRPGSSGSVAADDLRRSLQRGDSAGQASIVGGDSRNQGSRWGSVISGFWGGSKRRDSTDISAQMPAASQRSDVHSQGRPGSGRADKLTRMVQDLSMPEERRRDDRRTSEVDDPETPRGLRDDHEEDLSATFGRAQRTLDPSGTFDSPVKASVNIEDGIIDVDVPFPDYLTSFETAVSSPSSSGYLSTPGFGNGLDMFEQAARLTIDGDLPLNGAGFLQEYHPDFALQAIPPQEGLMKKIKASLKAEPSPPSLGLPHEAPTERWVDISSAIIADTTTYTVKRIRYSRLIRPKQLLDRGTTPGGSSVYGGALLTPSILPYETQLQENFQVEEIVGWEDVLAEAVERVIAMTGDVSKGSSSSSSRSNSKRRERRDSGMAQPDHDTETEAPRATVEEVSRNECKTVVLTALADIIRDVVGKRDRIGEDENSLRQAVRTWLDNLDLDESAQAAE